MASPKSERCINKRCVGAIYLVGWVLLNLCHFLLFPGSQERALKAIDSASGGFCLYFALCVLMDHVLKPYWVEGLAVAGKKLSEKTKLYAYCIVAAHRAYSSPETDVRFVLINDDLLLLFLLLHCFSHFEHFRKSTNKKH